MTAVSSALHLLRNGGTGIDPSDRRFVKTTLLLPTLNEIDGVRAVVPKLDRKWVDEIIVMDGGSTDGTVEFCQEEGLRVVRQKEKGYGRAILEGVHLAQGDFVIDFMADGNSLPDTIPQLLAKLEAGYDLVIASRYAGPAVSDDDDRLTAFGNWMFTRITNFLFGSSYTDVLNGYRGYRRASFLELGMDVKGLSWAMQSSVRFFTHGFKVTEVPTDEPKRMGGVRKMHPFFTGLDITFLILREYLFFLKRSRRN